MDICGTAGFTFTALNSACCVSAGGAWSDAVSDLTALQQQTETSAGCKKLHIQTEREVRTVLSANVRVKDFCLFTGLLFKTAVDSNEQTAEAGVNMQRNILPSVHSSNPAETSCERSQCECPSAPTDTSSAPTAGLSRGKLLLHCFLQGLKAGLSEGTGEEFT